MKTETSPVLHLLGTMTGYEAGHCGTHEDDTVARVAGLCSAGTKAEL